MKIKRRIVNELYNDLSANTVTILIGARQVGKTYLLKEVEAEARKRGLKTAYFDLEQPSELLKFTKNDSDIIDFLRSSGEVVFIDEFHYLTNASRLFKAIVDGPNPVKIYASGSSSIEMHKHLKESLVGRKFVYPIFPCSFDEIKQVITDDPFLYYLRFGGMPGTIHHAKDEKKQAVLSDILQSYILKDIKSLVREENIRAFNNLIYLLAQNQGSIVSTAGLASDIGFTAKTIESYLEILKQTFVVFPLHCYNSNLGNELRKSKKYYLYDIGIRNIILKNFAGVANRADSGFILESFVFLELQKMLTPETDIRFWRLKSGEEVDFVWIYNQTPYPIEVKQNWSAGKIPGGIAAFINRYPKTKKAFIVSNGASDVIKYKDTLIFLRTFEQVRNIPSEAAEKN